MPSSHSRPLLVSTTAALLLVASFLPTQFQISPCLLLVDAANTSSSSSNNNNNNNNDMIADNFFLHPTYAASGPIEDASCDVEQLEQANDSQLHVILAELMTTSFFRSFAVDLDEMCPLARWNTKKKKKNKKGGDGGEKQSSSGATSSLKVPTTTSETEEETEEGCAGGLPDLDPDAEPACSVDLGGNDKPDFLSVGGGGGFGGATSSWSSSGTTASDATASSKPLSSTSTQISEDTSSSSTENQEEEEQDEFECTGGKDELDDDAEPLCSLATDDSQNTNPFGNSNDSFTQNNNSNKPALSSFESAALHSISQRVDDHSSWESESQENTFVWNRVSDPVIENADEPCDDELGNLPETFWLDMCSQIQTGEGMSIVNLQLNPERNTGYNGTHIWNAIYEENCLALDGSASAPMCYEERVLYRLLSGLHTSTTLSIAKNYYPPSKRKGRENWEANAQYFIDKFADRPEHLRNLHFSYVVLLRALKKASPFLYNFEIKTGDILDDEMATILLRRLLDSTILRSCHDVFTAFDENLMFKEQETAISLQENFKGVFHNVSSILDCVQCQQCKLHGKMAMLGYGTALKILFLPDNRIGSQSLSRNEIVAFLNTIAKMSESVREVRELTHLYWSTHTRLVKSDDGASSAGSGIGNGSGGATIPSSAGIDGVDVLDAAVGAVSSLANQGLIDESAEAKLIQQAFQRHPELMVLSKHYGNDLRKFLNFLPNIDNQIVTTGLERGKPDAIVVGTGLAGLAATLNILDRGGRVTLIEKEHRMGGNSNKASSGINACCPQNSTYGDDLDTFMNDTIRSAGSSARSHLIEVLVENSEAAVQWLKERVGVDLSVLAQLGGHGHKRTHRPSSGMVGAEVIYNIQRAVKKYEKSGMLQIFIDTRVTQLKRNDNGTVIGVDVVTITKDGEKKTMALTAPNVILATGGFASDRSHGSYLEKYRPELMNMPATAGEFSTGDGITLGTSVGAGLVDMDKVQVHPTGWVDPKDPTNPGKVLAGELMRGVGGILINQSGKRFCNELGTRAYVTDKMFGHDSYYEQSKKWNVSSEVPTFSLVLSSAAAEGAKKHVDHYLNKGLLFKLEGVNALAKWMDLPVPTIKATLQEYQRDAKKGNDEWGKTSFSGVPQDNFSKEVFYAGTVTPVLHYCMGGLTIDRDGSVLDEDKNIIPGLHAAGEVSGGVHGDNRLGGNSLLECTVFGTIVGKKIPIKPRASIQQMNQNGNGSAKQMIELPKLTMAEVEQHNSEEDCWIAIHGKVYDLTDFAEEHPAGPESIIELAGQDGTEAFEAVHSEGILEDFDPVGIIVLIGNANSS
eukprot:CAMPEP_0172304912 /NCGR_PEP_ID=MMETSP1058-20130122/6267_1 /TAXON_ID=83371 /ORGANISM="Detonula confervacea, Strain CCMP 353" /LENGTH=1313 /DNA_ID=CAMNT_0013016319 /DNA_START=187 /DNA_END=4125 /DNA_ORIENTATION=+